MLEHAFNRSTQELEEVDLWVQGQTGLQSKLQDSQRYTEKCRLENKNKIIKLEQHWH